MSGIYTVWAIAFSGDEAFVRSRDSERLGAVDKAEWIARQAGEDGAVSVWVEGRSGRIIWAAGQKAQQLIEAGHTVNYSGFVDEERAREPV